MAEWGDLFTGRQKVALVGLGRLIVDRDRNSELDSATDVLLSLAVNKTADLGNALTRWKPDAECPVQLFARQAIGMAWDFCESVPPCDSSGSFLSAYQRSPDALDSVGGIGREPGHVQSADAANHPLPDQAAGVWFTDPPYYDSVPYSYISDFFYVWLKRTLGEKHSSLLTPMTLEPWYKVATLRKEVREGRSFNPDEFAIHLEQVVAGSRS